MKKYMEMLRTEIVRADRQATTRAIKAGRYYNPNALGLMLAAADRMEAALYNNGTFDGDDRDSARRFLHGIDTHFTNTPPARKVVKAVAKDFSLTTEVWAGYRDAERFESGQHVKG